MTLPTLRFTALLRKRVFPNCDGQPTPLTLVHAPAGYGKTTMVKQWVSHLTLLGNKIHWVSCREDDGGGEENGQSTFGLNLWHVVRQELEAGYTGTAVSAISWPSAGGKASSQQEAIERAVMALTEPTMLVLDDYERVTSPQLDLDVVGLLSKSSFLSITVISPHYSLLDGPLVTSQLPVMQIGAEVLAFTEDEVLELAALRGLDQVNASSFVWQRTLGWPIAVSLALSELQSGSTVLQVEGMLGRFASQHLEVLGTPEILRLFYPIVLCENISLEVLALAFGEGPEEIRPLLQKLNDRGLIQRSWFATGSRYRCHPGFAKFFREAATSELGSEAATRLQRAHARNLSPDNPDEAITLLIELGDYAAASEAIITHFLSVMETSARFLAAAQRIPTSEINNFPIIGGAVLLRSMADPSTPPAVLDRMHAQLRESVLKEIASGSNERTIPLLAVLIFAERLRGAGSEALRLARDLERRIERVEDGSLAPLRQAMSFIHAVIGLAALVNGDLSLAERSFQQVLRSADDCQNDSERVRAWSGLALVSVMQGDFAEGRERLRQAEQLLRNTGTREPQLSWLNREAARALLAVEDVNETELRSVLKSVEPILDRIEIAPVFLYAEALVVRARHGDQAARDVLRRRDPQINAAFHSSPYLRAQLASLRVNLAVYVGGYEEASRMLRKLPGSHPAVAVAAVRLDLFRGELPQAKQGALALLKKELPKRTRVETALIAATAAWDLGEVSTAVNLLTPALETSGEFGLSRLLTGVPYDSFTALVQTALELSGEAIDGHAERSYLHLLSILQRIPEPLRAARFEQLSPAEFRTLHALNSDRTTAQIAADLFVSQNTVKFHVRGIYRKLGVSNRAEALLRASDQGLLPVVNED